MYGDADPQDQAALHEELRANLRMNCLPETMLDGEIAAYDDFLEQRRKLMALKIKSWFEVL